MKINRRDGARINFSIPGMLYLLVAIGVMGCTSPRLGLFNKKSPREQYITRLDKAGLKESVMASRWFMAWKEAISNPVFINIPYRETGYFAAEQPSAAGYIFSLKGGEVLEVMIEKDTLHSFILFAALWKESEDGVPELIQPLETGGSLLKREIKETGNYVLRIQTELLVNGAYTLIINTSPSLAFPVPEIANPKIRSFWGAPRDGGQRRHEGVDIFAPFRTPALAAANGYISRVRDGGIGGKTIFMRPSVRNISLYYAHLDSQLVGEGVYVKVGDTIGLIGNTGNARTTPPHLHFGIYTSGGAVDPFPYIHRSEDKPPRVISDTSMPGAKARITRRTLMRKMPDDDAAEIVSLSEYSILKLDAAVSGFFRVSLPNGRKGFVFAADVIALDQPVRQLVADSAIILRASPDPLAALNGKISAGEAIHIMGAFDEYYFVKSSNISGWIKKKYL